MLSPGPTRTELALEAVGVKEAFDALGSATPIGRVGDPSETGAVAAFLASSDSVTGGEVFVGRPGAGVRSCVRGLRTFDRGPHGDWRGDAIRQDMRTGVRAQSRPLLKRHDDLAEV